MDVQAASGRLEIRRGMPCILPVEPAIPYDPSIAAIQPTVDFACQFAPANEDNIQRIAPPDRFMVPTLYVQAVVTAPDGRRFNTILQLDVDQLPDLEPASGPLPGWQPISD